MTFYQPLDLQHIFVNIFSGNTLIFTLISIIAIAMMAAYFRMSNSTTLLMLVIYGVMMSSWIGGWLLVPIIIIVGITIFWAMAKQWE